MDIALVTNVVDGDTIDVLLNGQTYRVRYIGIDTPETMHPDKPVESLGPEAAAKNAELVSGKDVVLVKNVSETDKYGRLLRYVFVGDLSGIFVNYELVRRGYTVASTYPPDVACAETFLFAQNLATNEQIGLWAHLPVPSLTPITRFAPATQPSQGGPCNCSGPDLNCDIKDFLSHVQAQACYNYCVSQGFGDVFRLDGIDNDGIACENLP